jgi:hypothetical protein
MTVLFRNLRAFGYGERFPIASRERLRWPRLNTFSLLVTVLILAGGVLGLASYFATQFLPHTRCQ